MSDCKIFSPLKSNLGNSDRASWAWLGLVTQLQYTLKRIANWSVTKLMKLSALIPV